MLFRVDGVIAAATSGLGPSHEAAGNGPRPLSKRVASCEWFHRGVVFPSGVSYKDMI